MNTRLRFLHTPSAVCFFLFCVISCVWAQTGDTRKPKETAAGADTGSPSAVYERLRSLGKHRDWSAMYDMLAEEGRRDIEPQLRAVLTLVPKEATERKRLERADGRALFGYIMDKGTVDFDRAITLAEDITGDRAALQVLTVTPGDVQIQDVRLVKEKGEWKFATLWSMRDSLSLPRSPTVSPIAVYRAFLTFRDRGDWLAALELFDETALTKAAAEIRAMLLPQAPDAAAAQRLKSMDDRSLMIKILSSGTVHPTEIVGEEVTGTTAILQTRILQDGVYIPTPAPVRMEWKSGVWRISP